MRRKRYNSRQNLQHVGSGFLQILLSKPKDSSTNEETVTIDFENMQYIAEGGEGEIYLVKVEIKMPGAGSEVRRKWCVLKKSKKEEDDQKTIHAILTSEDATSNEHNIIKFIGNVFHQGTQYAMYPYCEMILHNQLPHFYKQAEIDRELYQAMVIKLMLDLLDALVYMHEHKTVHCDLKPENIGFHDKHWCLLDFGCAALIQERASTSEEAQGTYYFMHPICHFHRERSKQPYNDLYALGTVLKILLDKVFYQELYDTDPFAYAFSLGSQCNDELQQPQLSEATLEESLQQMENRPIQERLNLIAQCLTKLRPDESMNAIRVRNCLTTLWEKIQTPTLLDKIQKEYSIMSGSSPDKKTSETSPASVLLSPHRLFFSAGLVLHNDNLEPKPQTLTHP